MNVNNKDLFVLLSDWQWHGGWLYRRHTGCDLHPILRGCLRDLHGTRWRRAWEQGIVWSPTYPHQLWHVPGVTEQCERDRRGQWWRLWSLWLCGCKSLHWCWNPFLCLVVCCYFSFFIPLLDRIHPITDDGSVLLGELMYLVFTSMPGESYRRWLRSFLLSLCDVFQVLINSLVCWF